MTNIIKERIVLSQEDLPEILTPKQLAQYLGIGYAKALSLLKYGGLPCIRIGNTFRISKQMLIEWLHEEGKREFLQDK